MAERTDNYRISRDRAQACFLGFDQQALIDRWQLSHDADRMYLTFLGRPYEICRRTGAVTRLWDGREAGFEEALSIFDLLCHAGTETACTQRFAPVNSLQGRPRAIGVGTDFHSETAAFFDRDPECFRQACLALGGTPMDLGDLGFSFPVFSGLTVRLKFYRADEEFPASAVLLWNENLLQYVYYETVFYIAGFLLSEIAGLMSAHSLQQEEPT